MSKNVKVTLSESEYLELVALSRFTCKGNLSKTIKMALCDALIKYDSETFRYYQESVRKEFRRKK